MTISAYSSTRAPLELGKTHGLFPKNLTRDEFDSITFIHPRYAPTDWNTLVYRELEKRRKGN